jgi:hypothetical protein
LKPFPLQFRNLFDQFLHFVIVGDGLPDALLPSLRDTEKQSKNEYESAPGKMGDQKTNRIRWLSWLQIQGCGIAGDAEIVGLSLVSPRG